MSWRYDIQSINSYDNLYTVNKMILCDRCEKSNAERIKITTKQVECDTSSELNVDLCSDCRGKLRLLINEFCDSTHSNLDNDLKKAMKEYQDPGIFEP